MTIEYGKINTYYADSTETKPTGNAVLNGSVWFEIDTGKVYMYDGIKAAWYAI